MSGRVFNGLARHHFTFGGPNKIEATLTVDGQPASRRVDLFCQCTRQLVRTTMSDAATGAYAFENIAPGPWIVLGHDHTGVYGALAKSDLYAGRM